MADMETGQSPETVEVDPKGEEFNSGRSGVWQVSLTQEKSKQVLEVSGVSS